VTRDVGRELAVQVDAGVVICVDSTSVSSATALSPS